MISWTGADGQVSCIGNCFEASTYGLSAEASQFIPVGTRTTVHLDRFDEGLEAKVCHCRKHGAWYRVGLQLKLVLPPAAQK